MALKINTDAVILAQGLGTEGRVGELLGIEIFQNLGTETPEYKEICNEFRELCDKLTRRIEDLKSRIPA